MLVQVTPSAFKKNGLSNERPQVGVNDWIHANVEGMR